jgi:8-oxo-dGTP pyrophosphatase MutT (NUDIX family)
VNVHRSLTDYLARWLAPTALGPAVAPAPLVRLVDAVAAARPEELSRNDPVPDTAAERQAAVLILIATDRADGPDVLLQQRAPKLRDHAGEVAFPGGAREDRDAGPPATAIREAVEETGVDPAAVEPLILLPRLHIPPSRFDVTDVLAHWRTPSPVSAIDPGETNRVMRIPFAALADRRAAQAGPARAPVGHQHLLPRPRPPHLPAAGCARQIATSQLGATQALLDDLSVFP